MKKPTPRQWTPEEDAALLAALANGTAIRDVADALDRAISSTHNRIALLRVKGVELPRLAATRPAAPPSPIQPAAPMPSPKSKRRPCLCCGRPFASEGPHNRLCKNCRQRARTLSPLEL